MIIFSITFYEYLFIGLKPETQSYKAASGLALFLKTMMTLWCIHLAGLDYSLQNFLSGVFPVRTDVFPELQEDGKEATAILWDTGAGIQLYTNLGATYDGIL